MKRAAWLVALVCALGCAELGRRTTVSVDEYAAYRRYRVAASVERKLAASFEYLRSHPRGVWRGEVSSWFLRTEPDYVDRSWNDASRLRLFLKSVPLGPQAERAAARVVELDLTAAYRAQRENAFTQRVVGMEARLAAAAAGRRTLMSGVAAWARRLAGIRTWGGRVSELDPELIYAYRLSEPAARCGEDACDKTVTVSYAVPEGKSQSSREAVYDVGLRLERGGVRAAWVTGPELFTRLGEAIGVASVDSSDFVERAEAIGQATQMIALAVEPVLPAARCTAEAVSPVVLHRVCDGVDLRAFAAVEAGEEDRILVEPVVAKDAHP